MASPEERDAWSLDQLTKSEFFHQKLHEWQLLEVAHQIEQVKGETLTWNQAELRISQTAWHKVIHRGIKPVLVFAHPQVLLDVPRAVGYCRMLAMVSQKSMSRVGLASRRYEEGLAFPDEQTAWFIAQHLNRLISHLIEADEQLDAREFDLWRGMAAGAQAQGSWQNTKGSRIETTIKGVLQRRLVERAWVSGPAHDDPRWQLRDGRTVVFADEPDVAVYRQETIVAAVEIKGGIDTAGVLERIGAAIKSLSRAKEENPRSTTILILQGVSVTEQAKNDIETNRATITHWFTVEEILQDKKQREELFSLLAI